MSISCLSTTADLSSRLFIYNGRSVFVSLCNSGSVLVAVCLQHRVWVFCFCLFVFVPATTVGLFLRLSTTVVTFLCLSTTVGMFLFRTTAVGPVFVSVNSNGSDFVSVYKSGPVFCVFLE